MVVNENQTHKRSAGTEISHALHEKKQKTEWLLTPAGGINHHENAAATEDPNSLTTVNLVVWFPDPSTKLLT